jgi:hypothetical protein
MGKAAPLALEPLPLANWPMHLVRTQAGIDDAFVHQAQQ